MDRKKSVENNDRRCKVRILAVLFREHEVDHRGTKRAREEQNLTIDAFSIDQMHHHRRDQESADKSYECPANGVAQ